MLLARFIDTLFDLMSMLILLRVIISWVRPSVRDPRFVKMIKLLYDFTEPILSPIRRYMPKGMMIDFSPWIVLILMNILRNLIFNIIY
ncbi:MAG: YggT family protein [Halanaerobiales bacterium]|nr:YggT family protein [Halanaerobiales bacterium]